MKLNPLYYNKFIYITFLILIGCYYKSQTITVTGTNWRVTIPTITEAGNNHTGLYESATNQLILAVSVSSLLGTGKISVHYQADPTWHNSLILSAKRTSNGSTTCVACIITGGSAYQVVTQTAIELFRIKALSALGSYTGINIK